MVKYERRPLPQVVADLYAARGEIFEDLFARAWALLDEAARRVLLVATFFSASASVDALSTTADVLGFAFDRTVERLSDLALLDVQQEDLSSKPRYMLHPLVRAFAGAKLAEQLGLEAVARDRWVGWYVALAERVGYCPNDLTRLSLLDEEYDTTFLVIQWISQQRRYREVMRLGQGAMYFFYVRGFWDKWMISNQIRLEAARILEDTFEEIHAIAYRIQMFSRQSHVAEAATLQPILHRLTESKYLPEEAFFLIHHCMGAYYLAVDDLCAAQATWQALVEQPDRLSHYRQVNSRQWFGRCLYYQGQIDMAYTLFQQALQDATHHNYERYILFNRLRLAEIELDRGKLDQATDELTKSYQLASRYEDREQLGYTHRLTARLHTLRCDFPAARTSLIDAIDLFERLGKRRELAEARQALTDLDTSEAPAT